MYRDDHPAPSVSLVGRRARLGVVVVVVMVVSLLLRPLGRLGPLPVSRAALEGLVEGLLALEGRVVVRRRLGARGLVQVLPGLAVVAVQAVAGAGAGGVEGGHGVAVRGGSVAVMFGTLVSKIVRA